MIEVLFVLIVVIYSCQTKREHIVLLLVLLLPFNDFLKKLCVIYGSNGSLFAFWKELAILILFFRSYKYIERKNLNKIGPLYLCLFTIVVIYYIIGIQSYDASICFRTFRNILVLPLLFISFNGLKISHSFIKLFFILLSISSLLIALIGIWEIHLGGRLLLRSFMGNITDENKFGVFYNVSNFTIMGFDRMCSIMTVPNAFGYLMAFYASFLLFTFHYEKNLCGEKWKLLLYVCLYLTLICLLESFCRTGWFLFFFSSLFVLYHQNRKRFSERLWKAVFIGIIMLLIIFVFFPNIQNVVTSTFEGSEISASDRQNNLLGGFIFIMENPLGFGLGSSENSTLNYVHFSESSLINISTEIGVVGIILYILFLMRLLSIIRCTKSSYGYFSMAIFVANMICMVSTNVYGTPYAYFVFIFSGIALMKNRTSYIA